MIYVLIELGGVKIVIMGGFDEDGILVLVVIEVCLGIFGIIVILIWFWLGFVSFVVVLILGLMVRVIGFSSWLGFFFWVIVLVFVVFGNWGVICGKMGIVGK